MHLFKKSHTTIMGNTLLNILGTLNLKIKKKKKVALPSPDVTA